MAGLGSGEEGQLTFLGMVNLISLMVGLMNLEENLTQSNKQDLLAEIHAHLQDQDAKLNKILSLIDGGNE